MLIIILVALMGVGHNHDKELFGAVNYISPEIPESYMMELIDSLRNDERYIVQVNKPYEGNLETNNH